MMPHARTGSIAVLGGGIVGFAAAAAFRRALPRLRSPCSSARRRANPNTRARPRPRSTHSTASWGSRSQLFRRATGAVTVPEAELRRAGRPAVRLVPLAEIPHVDGAALHQLWLRRTASGTAAPAWADVARRARRPDDLEEGLGVRFAAAAYLALLGELAAHVGVTVAREDRAAAELAAGYDLVIDTRPDGAGGTWQRIAGVPGGCDWSLRAGGGPSREPVETIDLADGQASWRNGAWQADARIDGTAGRVVDPWQGNVLVLGRAAVQCETFDGQPLAVALGGSPARSSCCRARARRGSKPPSTTAAAAWCTIACSTGRPSAAGRRRTCPPASRRCARSSRIAGGSRSATRIRCLRVTGLAGCSASASGRVTSISPPWRRRRSGWWRCSPGSEPRGSAFARRNLQARAERVHRTGMVGRAVGERTPGLGRCVPSLRSPCPGPSRSTSGS